MPESIEETVTCAASPVMAEALRRLDSSPEADGGRRAALGGGGAQYFRNTVSGRARHLPAAGNARNPSSFFYPKPVCPDC